MFGSSCRAGTAAVWLSPSGGRLVLIAGGFIISVQMLVAGDDSHHPLSEVAMHGHPSAAGGRWWLRVGPVTRQCGEEAASWYPLCGWYCHWWGSPAVASPARHVVACPAAAVQGSQTPHVVQAQAGAEEQPIPSSQVQRSVCSDTLYLLWCLGTHSSECASHLIPAVTPPCHFVCSMLWYLYILCIQQVLFVVGVHLCSCTLRICVGRPGTICVVWAFMKVCVGTTLAPEQQELRLAWHPMVELRRNNRLSQQNPQVVNSRRTPPRLCVQAVYLFGHTCSGMC